MIERLANVIYWLLVAVAASLVLIGIAIVWDGATPRDYILVAAWFAGLAGIAYAMGWATRYVLTGRKK